MYLHCIVTDSMQYKINARYYTFKSIQFKPSNSTPSQQYVATVSAERFCWASARHLVNVEFS